MHLAAVLSVNRQTDSFKICCEPLSRTLDLVRLEDCVVHSSFPADGSKLTPKWLLLNTLDEGTQDIRVIDDGIPNIVIARRDRLTLDVETIQILGDFCYNRLQPFSQWHYEHKSTRGQAVSDPAKGVALEQMSPANWAKFLAHSQEARRGQSKTTIEDTAGEVDGMAMDDGHVGDDQDALGEEKETFSDRAPRPRDAEGVRRLLARSYSMRRIWLHARRRLLYFDECCLFWLLRHRCSSILCLAHMCLIISYTCVLGMCYLCSLLSQRG